MITHIPGQLWEISNYFDRDRFDQIKKHYRTTRMPLSMQYDNRVLSSWSESPELQDLVWVETPRIEDIVKRKLEPQVCYVSLDLSGSMIMMHRLHPDILVQVQVAMCDDTDPRMEFAYCINHDINQNSVLDYQPKSRITRHDVTMVPYSPNCASIFLNEERNFNGMLQKVPPNTFREVLVMSYCRAN